VYKKKMCLKYPTLTFLFGDLKYCFIKVKFEDSPTYQLTNSLGPKSAAANGQMNENETSKTKFLATSKSS